MRERATGSSEKKWSSGSVHGRESRVDSTRARLWWSSSWERWVSREDWEDCEDMFQVLVAKESGDLEAFLIGFQNFLGVVHFFFGYPRVIGRRVPFP
jgi:hypothetical protein